jgi:hypothetical protein
MSPNCVCSTETASMPEETDWSLTTFEGNRRRQHQQFHALSLREKLARVEQMGEVAEHFASSRPSHGQPLPKPAAKDGPPGS